MLEGGGVEATGGADRGAGEGFCASGNAGGGVVSLFLSGEETDERAKFPNCSAHRRNCVCPAVAANARNRTTTTKTVAWVTLRVRG